MHHANQGHGCIPDLGAPRTSLHVVTFPSATHGLLLHSTARFNPLDPDRWTGHPAGQLVKGTRAPLYHSQSATGSSGTIANR